jgi:hypothetical protein
MREWPGSDSVRLGVCGLLRQPNMLAFSHEKTGRALAAQHRGAGRVAGAPVLLASVRARHLLGTRCWMTTCAGVFYVESGGLPSLSLPAEQATASQHQAGKASTGDGAGDRGGGARRRKVLGWDGTVQAKFGAPRAHHPQKIRAH